MKQIQPLPHGVIDYAMAAQLMSAPWLLGFAGNKRATNSSVGSGAAILGLSLMTRYPLGAVKAIPFPVQGVIETMAAVGVMASPWLCGFSKNKAARLTHVLSGLATLGVVAMTDYQAAERGSRKNFKRPANRMGSARQYPGQQVSTTVEYDQYSARPPLTHYRDSGEESQVLPS